ncbi:unnamed protein product [Acanthoscelides obtectus]|uniref:Uncharacterized protein n=1 Tax=Acanthoscelides obtectus TaxID=200917 RepID=A0A9P0MFB5_ACAOB|nr:unnamed protein product [Acanthoscelides obtectus]CAK1684524.1 hypothetical protein AOBTE_LOCUS34909 [Acanthoscelides obtectus]
MRNNNKHWQSFFAKIDGKYNFPLPIFFSILEIIEQGNKKINEINNKQESESFCICFQFLNNQILLFIILLKLKDGWKEGGTRLAATSARSLF